MKGFIYGLVNLVPGFLRGPADWIADRIYGVFNDAVKFALWLRSAFTRMPAAFKNLFIGLTNFVRESYTTLKWIIVTFVPRLINDAVLLLRRWVTSVLDLAVRTLRAVISTLERWARSAIAFVSETLRTFRNWAVGTIAQLWNNVTSLVKRVFDTWGTPARLAQWLLTALITLFWQYVYQQRDRIAAWFLRASPAFTRWLATELTKILARLI